MRLKDRVAIITGGGRGIGAAYSRALSQAHGVSRSLGGHGNLPGFFG